jgi:dTDP-4-dehydrorhamnose reductase
MILVTGANGQLGTAVVKNLLFIAEPNTLETHLQTDFAEMVRGG